MKAVGILGRMLFGIPFLYFGINHFLTGSAMAGMVPVPGGVFWIYFTGTAMILASVSIITKIQARLATLLLALMLLGFVILVHIPNLSKPELAQMTMTNMLKDISLMGGSLLLSAVFAGEEEHSQHSGRVRAATPIL